MTPSDLFSQRVGVLMGGTSSEREISLKSGQAVMESLQRQGLDVQPIDIGSNDHGEVSRLIRESGIDMAFIALHGHFGEDGGIQSVLEECGVPYTGSGVDSSRRAFDKAETQNLLKKNSIPVPPYVSLKSGDEIDLRWTINTVGGFPLVVKPAREGSSIGVALVNDEQELEQALAKARTHCDTVLVERCIQGKELTVGIVGEKALAVVEVRPKKGFFDYHSKYTHGATDYIVPADIPEALKELLQVTALKVHRLLNCEDFSRVDFMADGDLKPYVLEINTIPGFTATSLLPKAAQECGLSFDQLCIKLMEFAHAKKEKAKNSPVR